MILFRLGKSNVDPTFQDNQAHLAQFIGELNRIEADSDYVVSRIVVTGTASPTVPWNGISNWLGSARIRWLGTLSTIPAYPAIG